MCRENVHAQIAANDERAFAISVTVHFLWYDLLPLSIAVAFSTVLPAKRVHFRKF